MRIRYRIAGAGTLLVSLMAFYGVLRVTSEEARADTDAPVIELREMRRWSLESLGDVVSASISEQGEALLVLASGDAAWINLRDGTSALATSPSDDAMIAVAPNGKRFLSDRGCEFRLEEGTLNRVGVCRPDDEAAAQLVSAIPLPSGDWIEQRLRDNVMTVGYRSSGEQVFERVLNDDGSGLLNVMPHLTLSPSGAQLVEWSTRLPLSAVQRSMNGRESGRFQLPLSRFADSPAGLWHVVRPLVLDGLWLVVIADVRSDRRLLVLVAPDGSLVRSTELQSPIGFLAASHLGDLIALSDVTTRELVLYCWKSLQSRDAATNSSSQCTPLIRE